MPITGLVGFTGFVGGTLLRQHQFTDLYCSTNIGEIRGKAYDLLVCAAPSAAKWHANQFPDLDRAGIDGLLSNLAQARASQVVLISTVDVYPVTRDVDESFDCGSHPNHAYGANRLHLETSLRAIFPELYIVRLPGLFGPGLKKNVIYDLLHDNCLAAINPESIFQYYDLSSLWGDLQTIRKHRIPLVNLATEPIPTRTLLNTYFSEKRVGQQASPAAFYNIQTLHAGIFGERNRFRFEFAEVMDRLGQYIQLFRGATPV